MRFRRGRRSFRGRRRFSRSRRRFGRGRPGRPIRVGYRM